MKIIYKQAPKIADLIEVQPIRRSETYRPFFYVIVHAVDDGVLLYHTLTRELVLLSAEEQSMFGITEQTDNPITKMLIEKYYLVPTKHNDKQFMQQFVQALAAINNLYAAPKLNSLVVFTTSDCNARCFYCFERGTRKVDMTEQTAHDLADFIERKCENPLRIRWFGGEPLYNDKVIDIICGDLQQKGISFHSTMVTNGYLFDDAMVERAKTLWNLKMVQITLDGTEKVYNRIKNYIYQDEKNPFKRVLNNIECLLRAKIAVQIRLNMDEHNADDLKALSKLLIARFKEYKNCYIYIKLLYEDTSSVIQNRAVEKRHALIQKSIELQEFIDQNMPKPIIHSLTKFQKQNFCMTDNDQSAMVFADGSLGKCEHYTADDFYGSIYSDKVDLQNILYHKKMVTVVPECEDCAYRNVCRHPACCVSNRANRCDEFDKMMVEKRFATKMDNIYRKFKEESLVEEE